MEEKEKTRKWRLAGRGEQSQGKGRWNKPGEKAGIRGPAGEGSWEMEAEMQVEETVGGDGTEETGKAARSKG